MRVAMQLGVRREEDSRLTSRKGTGYGFQYVNRRRARQYEPDSLQSFLEIEGSAPGLDKAAPLGSLSVPLGLDDGVPCKHEALEIGRL
jgi:hypothetical protein